MQGAGKSKTGIGATIGNMIAPGIGGHLGHAAEGLFKTILGFGDYSEVENINHPLPENNTIMGLQTPTVTQSVENMHWNGLATRIAHRENIGMLSMTAGFGVAKYPIDPVSTFMFPWLRKITPNFQKWKLLGMVFEYVPMSATAISGGTPAVGTIAMSIEYDVEIDSFLPASMQNVLNSQGAVSGRPFDQIVCAVECDPEYTPLNPLYIMHPQTTHSDYHFYAFANLIVATQGPAAYDNCGQLWVTYDLQLISAYQESPLPSIRPQPVKIDAPSYNPKGESKTRDPSVEGFAGEVARGRCVDSGKAVFTSHEGCENDFIIIDDDGLFECHLCGCIVHPVTGAKVIDKKPLITDVVRSMFLPR
jgi:hypothetical protein